MGYIKVAKADAKFDLVSCENVGDVKLVTNTDEDVVIQYLSGYKVTLDGGTGNDFTQADVDLVIDAIQKGAGNSGPAELVSLSIVVDSATMTAVS